MYRFEVPERQREEWDFDALPYGRIVHVHPKLGPRPRQLYKTVKQKEEKQKLPYSCKYFSDLNYTQYSYNI